MLGKNGNKARKEDGNHSTCKSAALATGAGMAGSAERRRPDGATQAAEKTDKVRALALVAIVAVLLLSAMGYLLVCVANPVLAPSKSLLLDNRTITEFPECSVQTLASGEFQDGFEQAASDHVPFRDDLLQISAAAQRFGIRTANLPFGYAAIPTCYGSKYAEIPDAAIVQKMPEKKSKKKGETLAANADTLNSLAEKIDGTLVYYRPARLDRCSFSPAAKLMKDTADEDYLQSAFVDKLDERWQFATNEYSSIKDYVQDFYRTDHHWKISGAVKGYDQIMEALGKKPLSFSEPESVGWPAWYGSCARMGINFDVAAEKLQDVEYERSKLKVTVNDEEVEESFLDRGYSSEGAKSYMPERRYEDYYTK